MPDEFNADYGLGGLKCAQKAGLIRTLSWARISVSDSSAQFPQAPRVLALVQNRWVGGLLLSPGRPGMTGFLARRRIGSEEFGLIAESSFTSLQSELGSKPRASVMSICPVFLQHRDGSPVVGRLKCRCYAGTRSQP